jgi:hypothetical protein
MAQITKGTDSRRIVITEGLIATGVVSVYVEIGHDNKRAGDEPVISEQETKDLILNFLNEAWPQIKGRDAAGIKDDLQKLIEPDYVNPEVAVSLRVH